MTLVAFNNAYVSYSSILNRLIHQIIYEYRLFAPPLDFFPSLLNYLLL